MLRTGGNGADDAHKESEKRRELHLCCFFIGRKVPLMYRTKGIKFRMLRKYAKAYWWEASGLGQLRARRHIKLWRLTRGFIGLTS